MHMVIANAHAGDPYPVDVLFLYMANMAWNSSMNTAGVIRMLEDKDPATGEYRIPKIIYSDAYASEMVAYADLVLPDTTYLERHDCISLLDRPISEPDAVQDAIRWPVVEPDRDVRGFQSVLIDLAGRLQAATASSTIAAGRSTRTMPTTSCATSGGRASARSPAFAARPATAPAAARSIPTSSSATSRTARSSPRISRSRRSSSSTPTRPTRTSPCAWASSTSRSR